MLEIRHQLDGHRLYDDIPTNYGPMNYAVRLTQYGVLGVPLEHDFVRISTLIAWLLTSAMLGMLIYRMMKDTPQAVVMSAIVFVCCVVHLQALGNEPGHSQELIVLWTALFFVVIAMVREDRVGTVAVLCGATTAALAMTKINVGAFFGVAVLLAMFLNPRRRGLLKTIRAVAVVAALIMPAMLLRSDLGEAWAMRFVIGVTLTIGLCVAVTARDGETGLPFEVRHLGIAVISGLLVMGMLLAFLLFRDSTMSGWIENTLLVPLRYQDLIGWPILFDTLPLLFSVALGALALIHIVAKGDRREAVERVAIPLVKTAAGATTLFLAGYFARYWVMQFALPLSWLVLITPVQRTATSREIFLRRLLAFVPLLQVLQIYPVPGSQVSIGTVMFLPSAALCVVDGVLGVHAAFAKQSAGRSKRVVGTLIGIVVAGGLCTMAPVWAIRVIGVAILFPLVVLAAVDLLSSRGAMLRTAAYLPAVCALGWLVLQSMTGYETWVRREAVPFKGCHWMRLPERDAAVLRWLTDNLGESADTYFAIKGPNSTYFWSGVKPPTTSIVANSWQAISVDRQRLMIEVAETKPKVMLIGHEFARPTDVNQNPFLQYATQRFKPIGRVGGYTLYVRSDRSVMPPLFSCAHIMSQDDPARRTISGRPDGGPLFTVINVSLPRAVFVGGVATVQLVDLQTRSMLAATNASDPEQGMSLMRRTNDGSVSWIARNETIELSDRGELVLVCGRDILKTPIQFPSIRFLDQFGNRLLTLPVADTFQVTDRDGK